MTNVIIDIETLPDMREGAKEAFIQDARDNFKAPSTLTKAVAAADLGYGIADAKDIKFTSRDEMIAKWVDAFKDSKAEEVGIEKWKKTSFSGDSGQLITVCFRINETDYSFSRDYKEEGSEKRMLTDIVDTIDKVVNAKGGKLQPYFIGHNVGAFDLKFLFKRCVILGVRPNFSFNFAGRHGKDWYDTMIAWEGFGGRISQDNLCKALGLPLKPEGIDGSKVYDHVMDGKVADVLSYNLYDISAVKAIYDRLTFSKD